MNRDFVEMLFALCEAGAEFLVVGAHALAAHGYARSTGDLDIWVRPSEANAHRVMAALRSFGAPLFDLSLEDLQSDDIVFQMGVPPCRIDILTSISGVRFESAKSRLITIELEGREIPVLGREDLITNKRSTGRPKDIVDAQVLEDDS